MSLEALVDRLASDLKPVRPRRVRADAAILACLCVVELLLFLALGAARPDVAAAMGIASFWWKLASLGVIAAVGASTTLLSFDPVRSPRRGLRLLLVLVALCLAAGWGLDAAREGGAAVLVRLDWRSGVQCVYKMVLLSLPAMAALGVLMRRGAPTDIGGTSLTAGIAAAAWGAFVFVFACPADDPLYIAVWYVVGCGLVTMFARVVLPRLASW
jgi:hypothetical protein